MDQQQRYYQRKFKNFLLQPFIQVRLGLYTIILSFVFACMVIGLLYLNFYRVYDMVIELTDLRSEVTALLANQVADTLWWLFMVIFFYFLLIVGVSIIYTHKLVGPTYAFRRHIKRLIEGDYSSRVIIRQGDAFVEVADDLNKLAETLDDRQHDVNSSIEKIR